MKVLKKKMLIKFLIAFILIVATMSCLSEVRAESGASLLHKMESQANGFLTLGEGNSSKIKYSKVTEPFVGLGQILTMVGAGVLVAVTAYMGVKYLTSGPEAQAKLKIQLIGVVVSGMVIFGAYFIWNTVISVAEQF